MRSIFVAIILLFAVPALAETYKWVDDKGTVNFADDLGSVPKKYRKKVKVLGGDEGNAPQVTEIDEPTKGKVKGEDKKDNPKESVAAGKEGKKKVVYGGKDEAAWKADFGKLKADIKASEEQLNDTRTRMNDSSKMSRSEYLSLQYTVKDIEHRLTELRKKLDALNESAAKAGVPPELHE